MDTDVKVLIDKLYRPMSLVIRETETPWLYGVGFPLHHAEVHLLEAIKAHEGANVSELARHLGMTSGAISQSTKKLIDKGLIESYRKDGNRKEVFSRLTELGEKVHQGHQAHHESMIDAIREFVAGLDRKEIQAVFGFLDAVGKDVARMLDKEERRAV
jgi:DNA-binding MarR family transcriptional regulator